MINHPSLSGRSYTILVTGGTGFLGAYIIRDLVNSGYQVRAIRRSNTVPFFISPDIFKTVDWFDCDVLDTAGLEAAMEGVDAVIHSAAKVSFWEKEKTEMLATNIDGTAAVVNAALEKNIGRFIYVSSVAALGRKAEASMVNEEKKWEHSKANTHYSFSKYYGEMEVWRGIAEGLNAVIVNPTTILGYGDWNKSSCALFKNVYNGFPWYTLGINGFVAVEDVSKAIVELLPGEIKSQRFILNADNWSYQRLLYAIADGLGKKRPHRLATPLLGALAWRMEKIRSAFTGRKSLLTRESARVSQSNTQFDNSKILGALPGFAFQPLEETINKACSQYLHNLQR